MLSHCRQHKRKNRIESRPTWIETFGKKLHPRGRPREKLYLPTHILKIGLSFLFSLVLYLLVKRAQQRTGTGSAEVQWTKNSERQVDLTNLKDIDLLVLSLPTRSDPWHGFVLSANGGRSGDSRGFLSAEFESRMNDQLSFGMAVRPPCEVLPCLDLFRDSSLFESG